MSGTSLDDAPHPSPAMAVPSRTRPAQPAPHRPVPQPTPLEPITAMGPGSPTITPTQEGSQEWPPGQRVLAPGWLDRMKLRAGVGGDGLGDDRDPSERSRTSSSREPRASVRPGIEVAQIASAIGAMLGIIATAVGWVAKKRGAELRHPDEDETAKVAEPIARMLDRHVGSAWLSADVIDVVQVGAGVSAYVQTSPWQPVGAERPAQMTDDLPEGYEAP